MDNLVQLLNIYWNRKKKSFIINFVVYFFVKCEEPKDKIKFKFHFLKKSL
jgi:hypothetical protein